jgi:hypothetical protein
MKEKFQVKNFWQVLTYSKIPETKGCDIVLLGMIRHYGGTYGLNYRIDLVVY